MDKTEHQHIIEKHALIEAALPLLVIMERDMQSYGFGALYETIGWSAAKMLKAIYDVLPVTANHQLSQLPKIREFYARLLEGLHS